MGWILSMIVISMLLAFNFFAADAMIKMRNDVRVVRRMVADIIKHESKNWKTLTGDGTFIRTPQAQEEETSAAEAPAPAPAPAPPLNREDRETLDTSSKKTSSKTSKTSKTHR